MAFLDIFIELIVSEWIKPCSKPAYNYIILNNEKIFHCLFGLLALFFSCTAFHKILNHIRYIWRSRGITISHRRDYKRFSGKIKNNLESNESNRYLVNCFDSLYRMIISGDGFQKKELVLKCSLIDAIDRIHNGAKLGRELYLFFLEKTVELEPKHVIGIWDIETNPIPSLYEIFNEEIFHQYEKMYKSLNKGSHDLIRIFIYDQRNKSFNKAYEDSLEIIQYMEERWGIEKFYYIPKIIANINRIFDGLIIDDKFCLQFDENNEEVSFKKWNSNNSDCKNLTALLDQCVNTGMYVNTKEVVYSYPTIS